MDTLSKTIFWIAILGLAFVAGVQFKTWSDKQEKQKVIYVVSGIKI